MRIWTLKRGTEGPPRQGYPWIFSNQLAHSPKDAQPGEIIEVRDFAGGFVARGYAHPNALICFRALSVNAEESGLDSAAFFLDRLRKAAQLRDLLGLSTHSHRLCHAEGDGLPGLVMDRYLLPSDPSTSQTFVIQPTTAGMDASIAAIVSALETLVEEQSRNGFPTWDRTGVFIDTSSPSRALESLPVNPGTWAKPLSLPAPVKILVAGPDHEPPMEYRVNLEHGQKTGFFLDQSWNLALAEKSVLSLASTRKGRPLRILDLFSYVGQWGSRLSLALSNAGYAVEVTAVDASSPALELARANISAHGGIVETIALDIIENMDPLPLGAYDVVICDPPALAKRKKDLPKAARAYQKLNRESIRRLAPGGLLVTCSCSGTLEEEAFMELLGHAAFQSRRTLRWIARGGQAPDHPVLANFPEGRYLKCWLGVAVD